MGIVTVGIVDGDVGAHTIRYEMFRDILGQYRFPFLGR